MQLLLTEIDGMSKSRMTAILAGENLEGSSSSEEEEEEAGDVVVEDQNLDLDSEEPRASGGMEVPTTTAKTPEGSEEKMEDGEIPKSSEEDVEKMEEKEEAPESSEEAENTDEEIDRLLEKDLEDFI